MQAPEKESMPDLNLNIIIPLKNEARNVVLLRDEIDAVMDVQPYRWECIWVDDGSTDSTLEEIRRFNQQDARHQYVALARNYGQSAALYTGFCHARGNVLATLDGDGQNNPADLPRMLERLLFENCDMVNGVRCQRQDRMIRRISSRIANGFRNWLTHEQVTDVGCSLRVFRRACIEKLVPFDGFHRFLPTLCRIGGCSTIIEMSVDHRPRRYGRTSYGISNRLWIGILDTLAVRWLQHRMISPRVKTTSLPATKRK